MAGRCTHSKASAPAASSSSVPASSLPHLPSEIVEAIMRQLPPNSIALAVRQLSKEWRQRYQQHTLVKVGAQTGYLPPWAVLDKLQRIRGSNRQHRQRELLAAIARCGDLEGLQQLAQHKDVISGQLCSDTVLCAAARHGRLDVVRWLVEEQGCHTLRYSCSSEATASAAAGGHVHVLQYLRLPGHTFCWAGDTMAAAAGGGHMQTLEWLHSCGCRDNGRAYRACRAVKGEMGLEMLQWLWRKGYKLNEGDVAVVEYDDDHVHFVYGEAV